MASPAIQQVTTRKKTKQSQWEVREAVWKVAKEWVEEANKNNASRMLQEMEEQNVQKSVTQRNPITESEVDDTWQVLVDCKISLPLARLLQLVPRFTEKVATLITQKNTEQISVNYNQPSNGPTIMDEQSPAIKVVIQGQEVAGAIVDGGSGVNVINKTC